MMAEQAKRMGISPSEISNVERGLAPVTQEYLSAFCYWIRANQELHAELKDLAFRERRIFVFPGMDRKKTMATIRRFKQVGTYKPALIRGLSRYLSAGFDNV